MKLFRTLLLLIALAALGALGWHWIAADPGYIQIVWGGWSVETTAIVFVLGLVLLWIAVSLLVWLIRLPVRGFHRRRRRIARERLGGGLVALHEGRWSQAEKLLTRAAGYRPLAFPALLYAARAAQARGDAARAEELLSRAGDAGGESALMLIASEQRLHEGQAALAAQALDAAAARGALPPRGVELRLRALAGSGRAVEALSLLGELRRSQVLEGPAFEAVARDVAAAALRESPDAAELERRWSGLSKAQRQSPALVDAYAARAAQLGEVSAAVAAIEAALKRDWDEALALRYGKLPAAHGEAAPRIRRAESWLPAHPGSPALLTTLGRLCRIERLWGKSADYLRQALAQGGGAEAWEALAELHAEQGDELRARQSLENALRAARGDTVRQLPPPALVQLPRESEPMEERDEHGVPRLRGG